jgi:hypothetical protein
MDEANGHTKETSMRKIEANRRNAQRSTGPRTAKGKNVVKRNALKHGLLSKEVVILAGDGKESRAEYCELHAQLREAFAPVGIVEELEVERIAVGYWPYRRLLRHETGQIRRRVDTARWRFEAKRAADVDMNVNEAAHGALRETGPGIEHLLDVLGYVRQDIHDEGGLSSETRAWLLKNFDWDDHDLGDDVEKPGDHKQHLLERIAEEEKILKAHSVAVMKKEALEDAARVASLALPPAEVSDTILRYGAAIRREITEAITQLERLQRSRPDHQGASSIGVS